MALVRLLPNNARISGSVKLRGENLLDLSEKQIQDVRGKKVAFIFQEPMTALNPVYSVGFQISETLRRHFDMSPKDARKKSIELLKQVELPDPEMVFDKYPHQLSGGQRQRVMIAIAISCDPDLLIADEPTTALDVTVQAEILDLLRSLRTRLNSAILLITHDMGVVADLADKILVMKDSEVVEAGESKAVFTKPSATYTKELLA
jgi:peptide/nickel transport system ATP-binding protein